MDPSALGRYLRESREARELTLEDAVRALRIRRDILEAFEQGEFQVMDSTVRVRGMLRNYAHFLGLEEERVLQYYESAITNKRRRRFGQREIHVEPIAPRRITDTPPSLPTVNIAQAKSTGGIVDILKYLAMVLVSIALIAVVIFVIADRVNLAQPEAEITNLPTSLAGSVTVTPTNTATITPRATIVTDTPDAVSMNIVGIQVIVEMQQRSWVRVLVDEVEQYAGFLEPGYQATYTGNDSVAITAANAAALDITYNGVEQAPFGARGQEVALRFSNTGVNIVQGDGEIAPSNATTEATSEQSSAPVATEIPSTQQVDAANTDQVVDAQSQSANSSVNSGVITPTPLFSVNDNSAENNASAEIEATADTVSQSSATTAPANTQVLQATIEPSATNAPTSAAVLPLRQTQSNPTATKTG